MSRKRKSTLSQPMEVPEIEYSVEKILSSRVAEDGKKYYYLKWLGFTEEYNTWEPEGNLNCPDLIAEYNAEQEQVNQLPTSVEETPLFSAASDANYTSSEIVTTPEHSAEPVKKKRKRNKKRRDSPRGFKRGLQVREILGGLWRNHGQLFFVVSWVGCPDNDIVSATECKEKCPQEVIQFYENHLHWPDSNSAPDAAEESL